MIGIAALCLVLGSGGAEPGLPQAGADTIGLRSPAIDTSFFISVPKTIRFDVTRDTIRDTIPTQRRRSVAVGAALRSLIAWPLYAKPWRLLSITAVLAAVVKTSDVADMVTTLMQKNANPRKDPP